MSRTFRAVPSHIKKEDYEEKFIWRIQKGLTTAIKLPRKYNREYWFKEHLKLIKKSLKRKQRRGQRQNIKGEK
jgi:hypothetical protein